MSRSKLLPLFAVLLLAATTPLFAATHIVEQKTFDAIAAEFSGERAQELDRRIVEYHRIQGSPMMAGVAEKVVLAALHDAGLEAKLEQFPSDGATRYQSYISPIGWTMRGGELWLDGDQPERLCRYSDIPMCVSTYSKGGSWGGELVDVGDGTSAHDYEGKDVRGKVVLASGYAGDVVRQAVLAHGAVGTVIYPPADDRPDHPDMIRYNGLWTRASELDKTSGSFQISRNQYESLVARMAHGPVRVHGTIDATLGAGQLTLVHAWIRGTEAGSQEIILTAHLDHPKWSANDNASGSADLVEIARTLQSLIDAKRLPQPRRTIHFIWVPEYFGTMAYLTKHPEVRGCGDWLDPRGASNAQAPCVVANLNLDMVGEDTVKTNSRFYMTRTPLSVPSFLDALLPDVLEQTREADLFAPSGTRNWWPADMVPYFQGSDHDAFLAIGVPASMFGHDPDWTHHTSEDTPDKTDASEFRRVGVLAANAAWWVASASDATWQRLAPAVAAETMRRDAELLVGAQLRGNEHLAALLRPRLARDVALAAGAPKLTPAGTLVGLEPAGVAAPAHGARRATIGPVDKSVFEALTGDDAKWLAKQHASESFELAMFETLGYLDGHHSSAQIADALSSETGSDYDAAWVDRLTSILTSLHLAEAIR